MSFHSFFQRSDPHRKVRRANQRQAGRRPRFEALEDRRLLSFTPGGSYSGGAHPQAADFNNDGRLDLATVMISNDGSSTISLALGNGDGTFQQLPKMSPTGLGSSNGFAPYPQSVAVGDFNNDSTLDLAIGILDFEGLVYYDARILLGNGDGTFALGAPIVAQGYQSNYVATGDLDGDGRMDLVITSSTDPYDFIAAVAVSIRLGRGDGTFAHAATYHSSDIGFQFFSPVLADFNGDGSIDVGVPAMTMPPGTFVYPFLSVFLGNGDGTLQQMDDFECDPIDSAAVGDFNMDGNVDVVATSTLGGNTVTLLLSNGDGTFQAGRQVANMAMPFAPGDVNGDGRLDLVAISGGDLNVFLGHGDGSFATAIANPMGASNRNSVVLADFNADGRPDAAVAGGGSVSVLLNDGKWAFPPPAISVSDAPAVTEGNTGSVNATFAVILSKAAAVDVTVRYSTANLTAAAGSDYTAKSGTVTIPAGQTSKTFTVAILGDRLAEPTETFAVNLSSPTNATISDGQGIGTILDNEPRISINNVGKKEGNGNGTTLFTFTVTLSAAYDQAVTMSFRTVDGTATTGGADYLAKTGTLTFLSGETTKTITIEVKRDNKREVNEMFYLDLFGNSSNSLFTKSRGIGTILNDDK